MPYRYFPVVLAVLAVLLAAPGARADAIDGHWCLKGGTHYSIDGPDLVTPRGTHLKGEYDRHGFSYQVPAGEPDAGSVVVMELLGEEEMLLRTGKDRKNAEQAAPQTWHRCSPQIS